MSGLGFRDSEVPIGFLVNTSEQEADEEESCEGNLLFLLSWFAQDWV